MKKIVLLLIGLSIMSGLYFFINAYVYSHLFPLLAHYPGSQPVLIGLFMVGGLAYILGEFLYKTFAFKTLHSIGALWMGWASLSMTSCFVFDVAALLLPLSKSTIDRGGIYAGVVLTIVCTLKELAPPRLRTIQIPLKKLKPSQHGYRIIMMSDLHLDGVTSNRWLQKIVQRVNTLKPDLVVIPGDLIDHNRQELLQYATTLTAVRPGRRLRHHR